MSNMIMEWTRAFARRERKNSSFAPIAFQLSSCSIHDRNNFATFETLQWTLGLDYMMGYLFKWDLTLTRKCLKMLWIYMRSEERRESYHSSAIKLGTIISRAVRERKVVALLGSPERCALLFFQLFCSNKVNPFFQAVVNTCSSE